MFIQLKTIKVKEGHAEEIVERFTGDGIIEAQPGFLI
jgi:heme oxygenase (staphylobilin-producing)